MKLYYTSLKTNRFLLLFATSLFFISCGTYQSAYNDNDGIYGDIKTETKRKKVVIVDREEYKKYNQDYFTKEVERLDNLNGTDIFTDIDNYNSLDTLNVEEEIVEDVNDNRFTYNEETPWGYDSNNDELFM